MTTSVIETTIDSSINVIKCDDIMSISYQNIDDIKIRFTIDLTITTWFGLGFGNTMTNSDIIMGFNQQINDYYSYGNTFPILDTDLAGINDINLISVTSFSNGAIQYIFDRLIKTSDTLDHEIINDDQFKIIYSHGIDNSDLGYHGLHNRGTIQVNLFKKVNELTLTSKSSIYTNKVILMHAIGMSTLWFILVPIAIYIVRYLKHNANWLRLHKFIMTTVLILTIVFALAAMNTTSYKFNTDHSIVGVTVLAMIILQVSFGFLLEYLRETVEIGVVSAPLLAFKRLLKTLHLYNGV